MLIQQPNARVTAAYALLDPRVGKPSQFNTGDATSFRKAVDMTDDELAAIVARAKLTVVYGSPTGETRATENGTRMLWQYRYYAVQAGHRYDR